MQSAVQPAATCFGLIEAAPLQKPELLFRMNIDKCAADIVDLADLQDCSEISEVFSIAGDLPTLRRFLDTERDNLSPSAYGALSLYARLL